MTLPSLPALETPPLALLARGGTVFAWGLRRAVKTRKFAITLLLCTLGAYGIGAALQRADDVPYALWHFLTNGLLGVAAPLVALGLVATGFGEEVQEQTLVYHLVRPVSRATVFLGRFAAGAAIGGLTIALAVLSGILGAGVAVPAAAALGAVGTAVLGTTTIGAFYYALAALYKRGLVAGLVYTFVVEGFLQSLPGTVQKLSLTHHVRSVFHHLVSGLLAPLSREIAREVAEGPVKLAPEGGLRLTAEAEPWSSLPGALLVCAAVLVGTLWIGVRAVRRRDFALKD